MISITQSGHYELTRLDEKHKLLRLTTASYLWAIDQYAEFLQLLLVEPPHDQASTLRGSYRIYEITGDRDFLNAVQIELEYAPNVWMGYGLTIDSALPASPSKHVRIERTPTVITGLLASAASA